MRKRKYRQAAACFLAAALLLSGGPAQSALAETQVPDGNVQQGQDVPEEESTVAVTPGTEVSTETEPQTIPLAEQSPETETETQTEPQTETLTEVQTETPGETETPNGGNTEVPAPEGEDNDTVQEEEPKTEQPQGNGEQEPETEVADGMTAAPTETPAPPQNIALMNNAVSPKTGTEQTENDVASVTVDGTTTYYTTFAEALNYANGKTATITLLKDIVEPSAGLTSISGTITIIGNNHSINFHTYRLNGNLTLENVTVMNTLELYPNTTCTLNGGSCPIVITNGGRFYLNSGSVGISSADVLSTLYISGGSFTLPPFYMGRIVYTPDFKVSIDSVTASSITVQPLENQTTFGTAEYSLDKVTWQESNVFNNCHSDTQYTVYARYANAANDTYTESTPASTNSASYEITIPAGSELTAGDPGSTANISINPDKLFDLGYEGKVIVTAPTDVTLTRQNDSIPILSALLINGNAHTNANDPVVTFDDSADQGVTVSFAQPRLANGGTIPAGIYKGTMTFTISYEEQKDEQ